MCRHPRRTSSSRASRCRCARKRRSSSATAHVQPPPFEPDEESSYCFPLTAGTRTLGAVRFVYRAPTALDSGILAIAGAIFQQGAVALDRSLGYEEERVTRRRTERLQALTAGLSGALTSGDVGAIFIDEVIDVDRRRRCRAERRRRRDGPDASRGLEGRTGRADRGARRAARGRPPRGQGASPEAAGVLRKRRAPRRGLSSFAGARRGERHADVRVSAAVGSRLARRPRRARLARARQPLCGRPAVSRGDRRPMRSRARPRAAL